MLIKRVPSMLAIVCLLYAALAHMGMAAASARGSAFLSPEALKELRPDYRVFLESMSDTLVDSGLLAEDDKDNWIDFQLADFVQNGGYGSIAIMYNPDLLMNTDSDSLALRMTASIGAGVMHLDTLRAFTPGANNLPGLPLEVALETETGEPISCVYRWIASDGVLLVWDRLSESAKSVGSEWIGSDQILYWYDEPEDGAEAELAIEFISLVNGESFGTYRLPLASNEARWRIVDDANN